MATLETLQADLTAWTIGSDVDATQKRLDILAEALSSIKEAIGADNVDLATSMVQSIADSSRQPSWRKPVGESGLLSFMLSQFSLPETPSALKVQILRLTGNSCAETDENRSRVVDGGFVSILVSQLENPELGKFIVPVLYNNCVDYEPAQKAVSEAGFSSVVTTLITGPLAANIEPSINLVCKLLGLLTTHDSETANAPTNLPLVLLSLAQREDIVGDLDDFVSIVSTVLSYLASARFQTALIEENGFPSLLSVFRASHIGYDLNDADEEPDHLEQLKQARWAFFNVLSDISDLPEFTKTYPLGSSVCDTLKSWISPSEPASVAAAASISLGNLARSDTACTAMVADHKIHEPLVSLLSDPAVTDSQLLHASLSFLKNLSIPASNKLIIGSSGLLAPNVLPRIWEIDVNPQVQFAAVSLTRLLISNRDNFTRLYNLAASEVDNSVNGKTHIQRLVEVFRRTDAEPTKMEAARTIAAICRLLHTAPSASAAADISAAERAVFYAAHSVIVEPLTFLVTQSRFPVLRSEAWFVYAVMCRSTEGAQIVMRIVQDEKTVEALAETISGDKSKVEELKAEDAAAVDSDALMASLSGQPQAPQGTQPPVEIDRENSMVMIAELIKQTDNEMPTSTKSILLNLLNQGGNLLNKTTS
ncbi:hypothetical protein TD95_001075 [Thielaviopsis punctulata]|uniref:UNC-45/Cro1/She4 central domain-containing protein n=1 Tax=Thielaviopsis punctulata TaxID=72032 RepID=A0A0F4ZAS2_9PEZI|nr:hypothetical protein TD95_001075 [Thielaviopsis punctulata]